MLRRVSLLSGAVACSLLVACGSDSSSPPASLPPTEDVTGTEAGVETGAEAAIEAAPEASADTLVEAGTDATTEAEAGPDKYAPIALALEKERKKLGAPGAAVAIIENGVLTWSQGFGLKHPEQTDPVKPTTLFRIGSCNKMLTATAILQEVQAGKLDLEAPITKYLPEFSLNDPTWAPSITVRNLLTHSSGLADYLELDWPYLEDSELNDYLTGSSFKKNEYLMAPAGAFYNYSNPNFMLAGLIAEKSKGASYRDLMRNSVFTPLGMTRTMFLGSEVEADGDYAYGKSSDWIGAEWIVGPSEYDNPWARPAGYAWSSVLDLAKFALFIMKGQESVLGSAQQQAMQGEQINMKEYLDEYWYGFGLMVDRGVIAGKKYYSLKAVHHDGAIPGYAASIYTIPSKGFAFITLANTDGAYFSTSQSTAIQKLVELPEASPEPDPQIDPTKFGIYAGDYLDPYSVGAVKVALNGTSLTIDMPDLTKSGVDYSPKLYPYVLDNFVLTIDGGQILLTFLRDAQDKMTYMRTRLFVAKKVEETEAAAPPQAPGPGLSLPALKRRIHQAAIGPRLLPFTP